MRHALALEDLGGAASGEVTTTGGLDRWAGKLTVGGETVGVGDVDVDDDVGLWHLLLLRQCWCDDRSPGSCRCAGRCGGSARCPAEDGGGGGDGDDRSSGHGVVEPGAERVADGGGELCSVGAEPFGGGEAGDGGLGDAVGGIAGEVGGGVGDGGAVAAVEQ